MFETWEGLGINPADITSPVPGASEYGGSNAGPGGMPPAGPLLYQCTPEYKAKYRVAYGVEPAFCGKPIPPEATGTIYPETQKRPIPSYILPPPQIRMAPQAQPSAPVATTPVEYRCAPGYRLVGTTNSIPPQPICQPEAPSPVQPTPAATPPAGVPVGPVLRPRARRRTRQPVARVPAVQAGASCPGAPSVCPPQGYVTCDLPGTHEYGIFPCRRGQPVVIDQARMASLTADAQRRGLSDFDEILAFVQQPTLGLPMWAWLVAAVAIFMVLRRGRR